MKTSETLNKAADLIEERGWTQGAWDKENSSLCLEGGLLAALDIPLSGAKRLSLYTCPAYLAVADHLERTPLPACSPIRDALWQWNDATERTASEVIEVLRATAVIEAAREDAEVREQVSA